MTSLDQLNALLSEIAQQQREMRIEEEFAYEEELRLLELEKQFEFISIED